MKMEVAMEYRSATIGPSSELPSVHAPCSRRSPALRFYPLRTIHSILRRPQGLAPHHPPEFLRHGARRRWRVAPPLLGRSLVAHRRSGRAAPPPRHLLLRPPPDAGSRGVPRLGRPALLRARAQDHPRERQPRSGPPLRLP